MAETEIFKELGFTDREIKVYIALLELGLTTVGPIVSKTKLQHSKVYETLDKLIEKGLVSYIIISKTKHFQAANPKEILNILEERKRKFKEILNELELKQKYSISKQIAIVYEGFKSFKSLFNRIADELKPKEFYWAFAFKNEYYNPATSLFLRKFHQKLEEKNIDDRLIAHQSIKEAIKKHLKEIKTSKLSSQKMILQ